MLEAYACRGRSYQRCAVRMAFGQGGDNTLCSKQTQSLNLEKGKGEKGTDLFSRNMQAVSTSGGK